MTAGDVRKALRARYGDKRRYAIAEEVGLTTGAPHRRLDMIVLDCYQSNGFRIDGFEIKVSTSDLRRELEDPEKHIAFFDVIDYYTLAAPAGVVEPLIDVIPKQWGILIVNEDGSTRMKRRALALADRKADAPVTRGFFASVVRSLQQHSPSIEELESEYDRGYKEAEETARRRRSYLDTLVKEKADKIEAYDRLDERLHLWGGDVNEALDEFEAFRALDTIHIKNTIQHAVVRLNAVLLMLDAKQKKEEAAHETDNGQA